MAQACGATPESGVLEIGPGIGVLTRELAKCAGKVVAIELDDRLPPVLAETLADADNVSFVWGDCMKLDLPAILPTATIMLNLRMGSLMTLGFEKVFLLQNDLNLKASEVISTYVYKVSLKASIPDFSYSTAIGLFNSVINLTMISLVNFFSRKVSETSLW